MFEYVNVFPTLPLPVCVPPYWLLLWYVTRFRSADFSCFATRAFVFYQQPMSDRYIDCIKQYTVYRRIQKKIVRVCCYGHMNFTCVTVNIKLHIGYRVRSQPPPQTFTCFHIVDVIFLEYRAMNTRGRKKCCCMTDFLLK